jgi:hypothetical protein
MLFALGLWLATPTVVAAAPVIPDTDPVTLTTKQTEAGPHPILKWKPVDGASRYLLAVQTPNGDPYWTWSGTETKVRFGGGPLDAPKNTEGATLTRKMVWFVVALDDAGTLIASSEQRKIAP